MMEKMKLLWQKTNRWHQVLIVMFIVEWQLIPKQQLGFECNDPALSHSFKGDTISFRWLLASIIFLPLVVLLITERILIQDKISKKQALYWYREYFFGLLINMVMVQTIKTLVGAPRPHFFDTCSPKEASTCTGTEYIYSYTCTKSHWITFSDSSFPSGHASLAVHTGFFIAYYLHQRTRHLQSKIIKAIQIIFVLTAVLCSISRITDRRHHWWDVLAGAVLGLSILVYTISSLCRNFECPTTISKENDKQTEDTTFITDHNIHQ